MSTPHTLSSPAFAEPDDHAAAAEAATAGQRLRRRCPVCDRDNAAHKPARHSRDGWLLKRCAGCGMVYLENAPTYESLRSDFDWADTYAEEKSKRRTKRRLRYAISDACKQIKFIIRGSRRGKEAALLRRHVGEGRVLDVGCGSGYTVRALPENMTAYGVEISPRLAALTQQLCAQTGGYVVCDNAIDGMRRFPPDFFDGIMMRAFLEHEVNPRELLAAALPALKPGGRVIIKVPNYGSINRRVMDRRWCGFRFPDHVNYFTPATLRRLVQSAGYRVSRFGPIDRFPLSDNMWMVIEKP